RAIERDGERAAGAAHERATRLRSAAKSDLVDDERRRWPRHRLARQEGLRRHSMIRALYTAASGMTAQQTNIDNVAHNLANVNTTGFKKSRVEFQDLVYEQTKAPGSPTSTTGAAPIGLES